MVPKSRKEEYAELTRNALLESALELFTSKGYSKTSIEDIVRNARLTRGALYHHFKSKEDLFTVLYEKQMAQVRDNIQEAMKNISDPIEKVLAGQKAQLDYSMGRSKSIRLDVVIGVLGYKRWREIDSAYTIKVIREFLQEMKDSGFINIGSVDYATNLLYALHVEAALTISNTEDKVAARAELSEMIERMFYGLKS